MNKVMKKKIVIVLIAAIIILLGIFILKKVNSDKVKYEIQTIEVYKYFKYVENEKVGIIDKDANILINAEYDEIVIPNPENDVFICYKENTVTALNSSNQKLFEKYEAVEPIELKNIVSVLSFEKSVLKYKQDGKYGLIDFSGKEITKNIYSAIENLQSTEGKLLVCENGKYGVINLKGTVLVKSEYDEVRTDGYYSEDTQYLNSGFITTTITNEGYRYGYINYEGNKILNEEYNSLTRINDNEKVYLIASKNGRTGLYENSKKIIDTDYQSIEYVDNGALIIQKNTKFGIANLNGKILVEPKFSSVEQKGIYLYAESQNEKRVYDVNGEIKDINYNKTVFQTDNPEYYVFTLVNNDIIYYGIENKEGKVLVEPSYDYIEYVYNDYFVAKDDTGELGVINANGKVLIDFKYDTLQKVKGKNVLQAVKHNTNVTELYSEKLENICSIENAIIDNENGYIAIYNDKETIYIDNNGNSLKKDSEEFKNIILKNFPETIGNYKKIQASLDNIYYILEK